VDRREGNVGFGGRRPSLAVLLREVHLMPWHDLGVIAALVLAVLWLYVFEAENAHAENAHLDERWCGDD
jgi:hypothetical protein